MDNFAIIYKILSTLEKAMDVEEFDISLISPENLNISQNRWNRYIEMLYDSGYIKGIEVTRSIAGTTVKYNNMKITLKGLEYLSDNSFMKKAYKAIKGIADIVP